mmetsp:Transcript_16170/g.50860  ORF Transcript_16170/g.50860 Transcript_16170/m.50860 type:complete len:444 (-) Transcript_16170:46-1377(-)|eukprot:CAMPEP_0204575188 /NCGR_PEP_ID=MMETSP0661-20131031/41039_1 /ASSEMBLY_ACC=CAM_ASM_000606 /TAXON_ID=109239 /ORGANISM="Alexandrium margalefi, Strain AMGDE01CS-322" /LENGTH=443 /DNA_ID=CAMNT_0051583781 /DNA_START=1 /DNA_END=1332 /DNA_ORIENTATION=+
MMSSAEGLLAARKEPTTLGGVWHEAKRALPRFSGKTFCALVFLPVTLTTATTMVMLHDLSHSLRRQECWGARGGMDWAGSFVHWLSRDWRGEQVHCVLVPKKEALLLTMLILIPTWALILISSWVTRRLRRDHGIIRTLLERVYEVLGDVTPKGEPVQGYYLSQAGRNDQSLAFLHALEREGRRTKYRHIAMAVAFQVFMCGVDVFLKGYTVRWTLMYQVLWGSFTTTIVQVRPLVKFCVFLSQTLVDVYIELMRDRRGSWLELLEWHRELELDLLQLWGKVNLHVFMPSLPFASLSLIHLIADQDESSGLIVASFLLALSGLVLVSILQPIAKVSSMLNSRLAFKSQPREGLRKPGSMSVVAVARSLALEREERAACEDQRYTTFLEYVQGGQTTLALGIPGYFMLPISSATVASVFFAFILKLPLFVSLFLAARHRVTGDV